MNGVVNAEADRLETLIVARAADMIAEQTAASINAGLERFGVAYRVDANDPRLVDSVVELAIAHNEAHKRELAWLPDAGVFSAAERLCARALVQAHRIVSDALEAHVKAAERALVESVAAYREVNRIAVKNLGEAAADDWLPAPETAELFGVAQ